MNLRWIACLMTSCRESLACSQNCPECEWEEIRGVLVVAISESLGNSKFVVGYLVILREPSRPMIQ